MLAKLIRSVRRPATRPAIPEGERVYAIGDIHGRADLLDALLVRLDADDAARGPALTSLIFLGDLVDRGPDSAGVVQRVHALSGERPRVRCIAGNHEEIFLRTLTGDEAAMRLFCRVGGRETSLSYGLSGSEYERLDHQGLAEALNGLVPPSHRAFLEQLEDLIVIGDYAFVHAGVDPRTSFAEQSTSQLRWIRDRFLDHRGALEKVVVHGHSISDNVQYRPNRIGIDTGAYSTDRLTALGLEGTDSWELQT